MQNGMEKGYLGKGIKKSCVFQTDISVAACWFEGRTLKVEHSVLKAFMVR